MITLRAPLHGHVRGVIAVDLKLDKFSEFVNAQRPGDHGTAVIFDSFGVLIAHPDFAQLVEEAGTHPAHPQLPEIGEIRVGLVGAVLQKWDGRERFEGDVRGEDGRDYIFRLQRFSQGRKVGDVVDLLGKSLRTKLRIFCASSIGLSWVDRKMRHPV